MSMSLPRINSAAGRAFGFVALTLFSAACGGKNEGSSTNPGMGGNAPAGTGGASGRGGSGTGGTPGTGGGGALPGTGGGGPAPVAGAGGGTGGSSGSGGSSSADAGPAPGPDGGAGGSGGNAGVSAQCQKMVQAAAAFATSIANDGTKPGRALLPFAMRRHFKYTPGTRPGLPLSAMTMEQRDRAMALVRLALSENGFQKAETIRQLELVLRAQEGSDSRDPLGYYLAIYGTPAADGDWAFHWEGHHLSLHYTLEKCTAVADAPAFFGSNPARVGTQAPGGPAPGTRALPKEEDLARAFAMALSGDAQKRAMAIGTATREVQDSPAKVSPATPPGLPASAMSPAEVEQLKGIVAEYAQNLTPDLAAARLKRVQDADFSKVTFFWGGSLAAGQQHYYRIQGPTFMIEYLNAQGANHIHSVWRDFNGDFGEDLLQLHLDQYPH